MRSRVTPNRCPTCSSVRRFPSLSPKRNVRIWASRGLRVSRTAAIWSLRSLCTTRHYAGEYDFDWLLVAAQAYQESRLDESLRSEAGAVGVMQLLPSTAADPRGITQISHPVTG